MSDRRASWDCPACGAANVPGTDSCRVCGRHLHVDESTGASAGTKSVEPTGWGELGWGVAGVATPLIAAAIGVLTGRRFGPIWGVSTFAGLQIAFVMWRPVRRHIWFFFGWWIGVVSGVGALIVLILLLALAWSTEPIP